MNDTKKNHDLEVALQSITKTYGAGSIMKLAGVNARPAIDVISTGSISLDCALGVGGMPKGRIIEIFGPESSGKTTLMLHLIANTQKKGGTAAFIDVEHALDPAYAQRLGVNLDNLWVSQPDSGEEALTICEILTKSNAVDLIVVDSVAALVPKAELDGDMGMATMGMQARLMSQALRKLTAVVHKANAICAFTNQMREKVGVMFGSPETTPGGKALKFYASIRLDIRRKETLKNASGLAMGNHVKVKVVKNKVAPPFAEAEFDILYGQGINLAADVLDTAVTENIVEKKGAWFQYAGELIGQGKDATCQNMRNNPTLFANIQSAILAKKLKTIVVDTVSAPVVPEAAAVEQEIEKEIAQEIQGVAGLVETGIQSGIITKKGAWLMFNGKTVGHGKEDAVRLLNQKPELLNEIATALQPTNPKTSEPITISEIPSIPELPELGLPTSDSSEIKPQAEPTA